MGRVGALSPLRATEHLEMESQIGLVSGVVRKCSESSQNDVLCMNKDALVLLDEP